MVATIMDTNVVIDYLRDKPEARTFIERHEGDLMLSVITVAELYTGVKGEAERQALDGFCSIFPVLPVTLPIARRAGLLRNTYAKSHGLGLGDATIAATAQEHRALLATLNVKHFPMFTGLQPPYPSG